MSSFTKTVYRTGISLIIAAVAVGAYILLKPPHTVVVGPDSPLSQEQKRALFEKHSRVLQWPGIGSNVCFHLEPGNFEEAPVFGEYIRFSATPKHIEEFLDRHTEPSWKRETPSDYALWHFGVSDHTWWQPGLLKDADYYQKDRYMITVDKEKNVVYYSYVRSYSDVK